jgi:hypothetical protein
MSICKICLQNGKPGVTIIWDENIKSQKTGRLIPLESDRSYHKHYEPTKTAVPEPNDYPNPITATTPTAPEKIAKQLDLNNLNVIRVLVAALQEYIAIKEAGQ